MLAKSSGDGSHGSEPRRGNAHKEEEKEEERDKWRKGVENRHGAVGFGSEVAWTDKVERARVFVLLCCDDDDEGTWVAPFLQFGYDR